MIYLLKISMMQHTKTNADKRLIMWSVPNFQEQTRERVLSYLFFRESVHARM